MKLTFSPWYHWSSRNEYPGIAFPGIYVVALSEDNLCGKAFSFKDGVIYVGMTNSVAGLRGRLTQFDNTIAQKRCQHGGADRVLYKHQNYPALVKNLYVSLCHETCEPAAETALDLRAMGKVCNAEYEMMARCVEELGQLPEFNRKKESLKFSLAHGRR
ncbi:hypothetical protein [Aliidiomarina soli]|uniref:GIY-YIG domain-containing protein n=1 Tax=Aliidiomarina soli TaxID=1928574 RepID=A0A432WM37_9GAMM|nr:hypothetical protein [Aliidiomarina soli]RUO34880.1 hypothetical protein CWE14_02460 [Aliidiomarina soli]